jgi:hypothetical protein
VRVGSLLIVFRHTAAVHLLEAGVEVNVIRGWLGHVSLETTKRYAEITARMKEAAMKLGEPPIAIEESRVAKRRRLAHGASFSLAATLGLD